MKHVTVRRETAGDISVSDDSNIKSYIDVLKSIISNPESKKIIANPNKNIASLNKEIAASLHHPDTKVTELSSQSEFGLLVEECCWGQYYIGPYTSQESAEKEATRIIEDRYTSVGTQIFLVQDAKAWRKDYK